MVIGKGLEEFYSFQVMVIPSPRRFGLTWPVDSDVLSMTLSEGLPEWTLGSRVPSVVQSLHQVSQIFYNLCHGNISQWRSLFKTIFCHGSVQFHKQYLNLGISNLHVFYVSPFRHNVFCSSLLCHNVLDRYSSNS